MNILTDLIALSKIILENEIILANDVSEFPVSPSSGTLCLNSGVLYIYTTIDSTETWYPLTNKALHMTYTQNEASSQWEITHNLGTKNIVFFVYDQNDDLQIADIEYSETDPTNVITLDLTESMTGRCVIFAASETFTGAIQNPLEGQFNVTGDLIPETTSTVSLGSSGTAYSTVYTDTVDSTTVTASTVTSSTVAASTITADSVSATTFDGEATSAQYADLAEKYTCEAEYLEEGTVMEVSIYEGSEVEECDTECSFRIAGVVSTAPAYLMNSSSTGVACCLTGKVPVRIVGIIEKGDPIVSAGNGCARAAKTLDELIYSFATSFESSNNEDEKLIMCQVKI